MKLSNAQLKYLKSLHLRKFRQKYHNFVVEGSKMVEEVLADGRLEVEAIFAVPAWELPPEKKNSVSNSNINYISEAELKKISTLTTPNKVMLVAKQPDHQFDETEQLTSLALYLDGIQDPGNFGTILRIADWFGIEWIFCAENCVELFNPKTIQASMGAFLRVKCQTIDFRHLIEKLPSSLPKYGAMLSGSSIFETVLTTPALLVIGNESKGISSEIQSFIDHPISIPKGASGGAESLNAAVATGILCAQFLNRK